MRCIGSRALVEACIALSKSDKTATWASLARKLPPVPTWERLAWEV